MITEHEADIASAGMEVMIHAAERFIEVLCQHYEQKIRERDEYKQLRKLYGKARADEYVRKLNRRMLMQDEKMRLGEWVHTARTLLAKTDRCTEVGMACKKHEDVSAGEMFSALQNDANAMCRLFLYYGNIPEENMVKMESTMKVLGTRTEVPTSFIEECFRPK